MTATYYSDDSVTLYHGDAAATVAQLEASSIDCVVTSPPYWGVRDYGESEQLGQEPTWQRYVAALCDAFDQVARVLRPQGTVWLNIGDRYSSRSDGFQRGSNNNTRQPLVRPAAPDVLPKSLVGLPWRVALALHDRGWVIRQEIVWHKPKPIPERARDRFTGAHETVFLLTRSRFYYFADPGPSTRNSNVWTLPHESNQAAHEAPFPQSLPWRCIEAGCPEGGVVMDPFSGTGTTGEAARRLGRSYIGIDLSARYLDMQVRRFAQAVIA